MASKDTFSSFYLLLILILKFIMAQNKYPNVAMIGCEVMNLKKRMPLSQENRMPASFSSSKANIFIRTPYMK
jgi:hypothetical protein